MRIQQNGNQGIKKSQVPEQEIPASRKAPLAPASFDPEKIFQGIRWHQKWEIYSGI